MNEKPIVINAYIPESRKELEDLYIEVLNEKNWLCHYLKTKYKDEDFYIKLVQAKQRKFE
jgi:hypothetical protein